MPTAIDPVIKKQVIAHYLHGVRSIVLPCIPALSAGPFFINVFTYALFRLIAIPAFSAKSI
jgi:hypothetical protein